MESNNEKIENQNVVNEENKKVKETKINIKSKFKFIVFGIAILIILLLVLSLINSKSGSIETKVKVSLDRIVEKSDLETANITYNVIAKKCKTDGCDKSSNNIKDFEYVVSCKGTITAGIDFNNVKLEVDKKNKKVTITIPEASITGEPNIGSIKFLDGNDVAANELPNARNLCKETVIEKSEKQ